MLIKIEIICNSKLSTKNLFNAINESAMSLLNYIIGPTTFTEKELQLVDKAIRRILLHHNINYRAANKDRLYMNRKDYGRGLCSVVHKYELIKPNLSQ
jgi:hypothetical protein